MTGGKLQAYEGRLLAVDGKLAGDDDCCCATACDVATDCVIDPIPGFLYVTLQDEYPPSACPANPSLAGDYTLTQIGGQPTWQYGTQAAPVDIGDCVCDFGSGTYLILGAVLSCTNDICQMDFTIALLYWHPGLGSYLNSVFFSYRQYAGRNRSSWTVTYRTAANVNRCLNFPPADKWLYNIVGDPDTIAITSTAP